MLRKNIEQWSTPPFIDPDILSHTINEYVKKGQQQRASFAYCYSKTTIQSKFYLMIIVIDELETVMRHHRSTLINLEDKLSKLHKEKPHIYTTLLLDTIEQRRQAMKQRFFRIREYKLKTFFDEAPTVANNNIL
ncbi:unnamed protein product [Didymodactylos carnosus]|uniref:Uncharacterized protein n=1 Tax=Didymodactylos carnosus TaxID=1234261 RepID=A0A814UM84_9BILA|nr:unnamed protein product [Didymodactylos carnosus]CAF1393029.1 unnamed protein product [Didymodactylos carnosus]CAF3941674.1 unnamed protein product [Didymodactylos carnosus]CAF4200583.1 unnamed protein product [Didymodactylos carnosus]